MTARTVSLGAIILVAFVLAVVAWPDALGVQRSFPIALLVSLRGLVAIAAIVLAVPFAILAARSKKVRLLAGSISVLLIAFAGVNVAIVSSGQVRSVDAAGSITVLSWNTLGGAPGADVIAQLALDTRADVVSLPETTKSTGAQVAAIMAANGMPVQEFTLAYDQESPARSTTLLVSESLGEYRADAGAKTTLVLPTVVATPVDGVGPTFVAAHTLAPLPPMMLAWQDDLAWVAGICSKPDVIVAGDFNATVDHFAGLGSAALGDCVDAAESVGAERAGTWPSTLPVALSAPIDHVLATPEWHTLSFRVIETHDGYGSDHRPVVATLSRVENGQHG